MKSKTKFITLCGENRNKVPQFPANTCYWVSNESWAIKMSMVKCVFHVLREVKRLDDEIHDNQPTAYLQGHLLQPNMRIAI